MIGFAIVINQKLTLLSHAELARFLVVAGGGELEFNLTRFR